MTLADPPRPEESRPGPAPSPLPGQADPRAGAFYALAAFGFWGFNPVYFKIVEAIPPTEVLVHRVVWSVLMMALIITWARRWPAILAALRQRRTLLVLCATSLIISSNWLLYIWAIQVDRVLETSLGYYINPLVSVLLGMVFLRERLTRLQAGAVVLAAAGVLNLAIGLGALPWIALVLAFSFGTYGLLRKVVPVGSVEGLFIETLIMFPFGVGWMIWLGVEGSGSFGVQDRWTDLLLILAGPVTMLPLIWFTSAAKRLPLSMVGFFQYIAPSLQFLLAVFAFGEPFTGTHLVTFLLIWTAVGLFLGQSWLSLRARRRALPVA